jgi:hypothetical protein
MEEWREMIAFIEPRLDSIHGIYVFTAEGDQGGPNALQRRLLGDMYNRYSRQIPLAVMTKSMVVRTMLTAINLFSKSPTRPFPHENNAAAFQHIGVPAKERSNIETAVRQELFRLNAVEKVRTSA